MPTAIIAAAGKGVRLEKNIPKAFVEINKKPLLFYSIEKFKNFHLIVVLPEEFTEKWKRELKLYFSDLQIEVVPGGKERQDSVLNALEIIEDENEIVLIHDVARPLVSEKLIKKIVENTVKYGACIPVIQTVDTLKEVENWRVIKTVNRNKIFAVQTPQGFKAGIIKKAYVKAKEENFSGTDDAMLVERTGKQVYCIEGERKNFKITYPEDLLVAEILLKYKGGKKNG